jgi:asparagine synthase (glutamine-hydrolysing)
VCGFVGVVGADVTADALEDAAESLRHRGPDDGGFYASPTRWVALAHRRLAIIDVAHGKQPMTTDNAASTIVFNGEIYNFRRLRTDLEAEGVRFFTQSDTEVLLAACPRWGTEAPAKLNGDFAFAYCEERERTLFLARDPFGIKPLYYYWDGSVFAFASEATALLRVPGVNASFRPEGLSQYLHLGGFPTPTTPWTHVYKLPPGTVAVLKNGQLELSSYIDLFSAARNMICPPTFEDAAEELRFLLADSVRKRMISDVPLGAFLSGGLDSSAVTALMAETGAHVRTFSIGFDERDFDELAKARAVAARFGTEHHEEIVRPNALEDLPRLAQSMDEPLADPAALPTSYLSRMTRRHVTVALSGDGGDEVLLGYPRHQAFALSRALARAPRSLRAAATRSLGWVPTKKRTRLTVAKRLITDVDLNAWRWYQRRGRSFDSDEVSAIMQPSIGRDPIDRPFVDAISATDDDSWDAVAALDLQLGLADRMLVKVDRVAMRSSLEVRVPFLDPRVATFLLGLPAEYRLRHLMRKALLVHGFRDTLSVRTRYQRKRGFALPHGAWFRGPMARWLRDLLLGSRTLARYLRPEVVERLVVEHQDGRVDHADALWTLSILALWLENHVP